MRFPHGFLWGAQTAPTQVEGGGIDNNMIEWAHSDSRRIRDHSVPLPGTDHFNRLEEDYAHLRLNRHSAHAFGIDWSRIEPREGVFDQVAVDHYKREIAICRANSMEPIVTLLHYAIPNWLTANGGVLAVDAPALFERFCRFAVDQVGDGVTWWSTLNEPNTLAGMSYMLGTWPPGEVSLGRFLKAMGATLRLHAAGARAIRSVQNARGRTSMISIAHNMRPMHPARRWNPFDWVLAKIPGYIVNQWFLNSVRQGRPMFGLAFGGDGPIEGLEGSLDWIGLNYYTRNTLAFAPISGDYLRLANLNAVRGRPATTYPTNNTYDPDGLYEAAMDLWEKFHLPMMVTENGISDLSELNRDGALVDQLRPRYLVDVAAVMHHLISAGVPITGYMHWTDWDNWEWTEGWHPKFGLFSFDPATGQRRDKFGATVYKTIAAHNAIPGAWLTAENRQSPADRESYSKQARTLHHIRVHRSPRPLTREP
jgi:beta-glucosidase